MQEKASLINFYEAFSYGWETTKKNWVFLLAISFLVFLTSLIFEFLDFLLDTYFVSDKFWSIILYSVFLFIYFLVSVTLQYNSFKLNLNILNKKKILIKKLFILPDINLLRFLVGNIIYMVLVFAGLVAFIIPGIYFYIKYFFVPMLIVDKKMTVLKAARKSAEMTLGVKWEMFAYLLIMFFVCFLIVLAGLFALLIGVIPAIFIATWLTTFANLYIYKKLL